MDESSHKRTKSALELSIIPGVLASSCCLTIPGLSLMGFSFAERLLAVPDWLLRAGAFLFLILSVLAYLYSKDVRSINDYKIHKRYVLLLFIQTLTFSLMIYLISLYLLVPVLCDVTGVTMCRS